ncbi:MAG: N-acetyltransferase [Hydrotalea sp.]|nr:N-acetyltransferase [Hydrotalea sp.]
MWQEKHIRREQVDDFLDSENFLDRVFGLARHNRTVNYLRKNIAPDYHKSFHYRDDNDQLLALIRLYHLELSDKTRAGLLGPLAVHPDYQNKGLGSFLIRHLLAMVDKTTATNYLLFLVGNPSYYERHGFCKLNNHDTEQYSFDGPIAPLSLLVRCHDKQEILRHSGRLHFISGLE